MPEPDVLEPLAQAIEEFHKLREDSRRLLERARWPEVKEPVEQAPSPEEELSPGSSVRARECRLTLPCSYESIAARFPSEANGDTILTRGGAVW
jgi:hypothetical protein